MTFVENVTCPGCELIFEGEFTDETHSLSVQDMTDPPLGRHHCPECGFEFCTQMTGWMFYSEAG